MVCAETESQTDHNKCGGTSALCASHQAVPSELLADLGPWEWLKVKASLQNLNAVWMQ